MSNGITVQLMKFVSDYIGKEFSKEAYIQSAMDSFEKLNDKQYKAIFRITKFKDLQFKIQLNEEIVKKVNTEAFTKSFNNGGKHLSITGNVECPGELVIIAEQEDEDSDVTIIDASNNFASLDYKLRISSTAIGQRSHREFGSTTPERTEAIMPAVNQSLKQGLSEMFGKNHFVGKSFKSWDVAVYNTDKRDLETLKQIKDESKIEIIIHYLKKAYSEVSYYEKQEICKFTKNPDRNEELSALGLLSAKDVSDNIVNYLSIDTREIDNVAAKLSKLRNNNLSSALKSTIPNSLIEASQSIYELRRSIELYTSNVASCSNNELQSIHVATMKKLRGQLNITIDQLQRANKLFDMIINNA